MNERTHKIVSVDLIEQINELVPDAAGTAKMPKASSEALWQSRVVQSRAEQKMKGVMVEEDKS